MFEQLLYYFFVSYRPQAFDECRQKRPYTFKQTMHQKNHGFFYRFVTIIGPTHPSFAKAPNQGVSMRFGTILLVFSF